MARITIPGFVPITIPAGTINQPEPDFDQIARRLLDDLPDAFLTRGASDSVAAPGVVAVLRQVWNARGDADIKALEGHGGIDSYGVAEALSGLDR